MKEKEWLLDKLTQAQFLTGFDHSFEENKKLVMNSMQQALKKVETGYNFEMDATSETLCGRMGRKHRMKRIHHSKTICIYKGCDGFC